MNKYIFKYLLPFSFISCVVATEQEYLMSDVGIEHLGQRTTIKDTIHSSVDFLFGEEKMEDRALVREANTLLKDAIEKVIELKQMEVVSFRERFFLEKNSKLLLEDSEDNRVIDDIKQVLFGLEEKEAQKKKLTTFLAQKLLKKYDESYQLFSNNLDKAIQSLKDKSCLRYNDLDYLELEAIKISTQKNELTLLASKVCDYASSWFFFAKKKYRRD